MFYRQLTARGGASPRDRIQHAHALKEAGETGAALAAYRAATTAEPLSANAHHELSHFLHRLGDTDAALDALLRGWVADPTAVDLPVELARLGVDRGDLDRYVQLALTSADSVAEPTLGRLAALRRSWILRSARRAARRAQWAAAERTYRAVLVLRPYDPGVRVQLGHMLGQQGRGEEALAAYRTALLLRPRDADILLHIGHALKRLDRPAAAFGAYLAAWRLRPGSDAAAAELVALRPGLTREQLRIDGAGLLLLADGEGPTRLPMPADLSPRHALYYCALAGSLGV